MSELSDEQLENVQTQVSTLMDNLPVTLRRIDQMNQMRRERRRTVYDDKIVMKKHRDFIGVGIVLEEYKKNPDNAIAFISELKKRVDEIRPFNPDLAEMIEKAEVSIEVDIEETQVLFQLHRILKIPSMEKIIAELRQNPIYYLNRIKDENFARELRYLFSIILGIEAGELRKHLEDLTKLRGNLRGYIEDLERDLEVKDRIKDRYLIKKLDNFEQRLPQNIDEEIKFLEENIKRIHNWIPEAGNFGSYLSELQNNIRQLLQFKDERLIKAINDTNITKRFLFFEFEHYYFADVEHHDKEGRARMGLLRMVRKGEEENDWDDFLKVPRNIKKEAEYVRKEFGDVEVAQRLVDIEAKYHDSPEAWKIELRKLIAELIMNGERMSRILEGARSALITLFNTRRNELLRTLQSEETKLAKIIEDRAKDLEKRKEKAIKDMRKLVDKKIKETHGKSIDMMKKIFSRAKAIELQARKNLDGIRTNIDNVEREVIINMVNLVVDTEKTYNMPGQDEKAPQMQELLNKSEAWERYVVDAIRKAGKIDPKKGFSLLANYVIRGVKIIKTIDKRVDNINESIVNIVTTDFISALQELMERGKILTSDIQNLLKQYDIVIGKYFIKSQEETIKREEEIKKAA